MQGDRHGVSAFRIDQATGALTPHGEAIALRHRPVHLTVDANATHVLVAYNNPSGMSVHDLKADGTLGAEVNQPHPLDAGIYAHQVRVDPANKMAILVTRGNGRRPGERKIRVRSRSSATTMACSPIVSRLRPTAGTDFRRAISIFIQQDRGFTSRSKCRASLRC